MGSKNVLCTGLIGSLMLNWCLTICAGRSVQKIFTTRWNSLKKSAIHAPWLLGICVMDLESMLVDLYTRVAPIQVSAGPDSLSVQSDSRGKISWNGNISLIVTLNIDSSISRHQKYISGVFSRHHCYKRPLGNTTQRGLYVPAAHLRCGMSVVLKWQPVYWKNSKLQ